jgi:hypothetical protein
MLQHLSWNERNWKCRCNCKRVLKKEYERLRYRIGANGEVVRTRLCSLWFCKGRMFIESMKHSQLLTIEFALYTMKIGR